jgi:cation diffusion facilitator CzcD-associated flavoprotein CzcO
MSMDTPAKIAVLGAGPMGLEVGLYARYLGYDVVLLERDEVAAHVLKWGHLRMFSPFSQLCSPLGLAALRAQDSDYSPPQMDAQLTGRQWVDQYLYPLARTDLLVDHIECGAAVQGVARSCFLKTQRGEPAERANDTFCILVRRSDGSETIETADIVIDATGVYGHPNWCGPGGIPARGEQRLHGRIEYGVPDILGTERSRYEAQRVLVIGSGLSAAATTVALSKLVDRVPQTEVTWVTHAVPDAPESGPIRLAQFDPLSQRRRLAEMANKLAQDTRPRLTHLAGRAVEAFDFDAASEEFLVWLDGDTQPRCLDRVIANVGYRGDPSLYAELQVASHPRTGGALAVGNYLDDLARSNDAPQRRPATWTLTTEPHFHVLGAKSYGRDSSFLMPAGHQQIRDVFSIIGDRTSLDLYATMHDP